MDHYGSTSGVEVFKVKYSPNISAQTYQTYYLKKVLFKSVVVQKMGMFKQTDKNLKNHRLIFCY